MNKQKIIIGLIIIIIGSYFLLFYKSDKKQKIISSKIEDDININTDCIVSNWTNWSDCDNNGYSKRTRIIIKKKRGDGIQCPNLIETKKCKCIVDTNWSKCNNNYIEKKIKYNHTGIECENIESIKEPCRNCILTDWSDWTECNNQISCNGQLGDFVLEEIPDTTSHLLIYYKYKDGHTSSKKSWPCYVSTWYSIYEKHYCHNNICDTTIDNLNKITNEYVYTIENNKIYNQNITCDSINYDWGKILCDSNTIYQIEDYIIRKKIRYSRLSNTACPKERKIEVIPIESVKRIKYNHTAYGTTSRHFIDAGNSYNLIKYDGVDEPEKNMFKIIKIKKFYIKYKNKYINEKLQIVSHKNVASIFMFTDNFKKFNEFEIIGNLHDNSTVMIKKNNIFCEGVNNSSRIRQFIQPFNSGLECDENIELQEERLCNP